MFKGMFKRWRRRSGRVLLPSLLLLSGPVAVAQQQLSPATSDLDLNAFGQELQLLAVGSVNGSVDNTGSRPWGFDGTFFYTAVASGMTTTGMPPTAVAEAASSASFKMPTVGGSPDFPVVESSAGAGLNYSVAIRQRRTPPITFQPPVFLTASAIGEATVQGYGSAQAGVLFQWFETVNGLPSFTGVSAGITEAGSDSFNRSFRFRLETGGFIVVSMTASARTFGPQGALSYQSSAIGVADPVFEFDQEAFEDYLESSGEEPFELADYYAIEYSDGIVPGLIFKDNFEPLPSNPLIAPTKATNADTHLPRSHSRFLAQHSR